METEWIAVMDRFCELTKTAELEWELVPGKGYTYQSVNEGLPRCVVCCCNPVLDIKVEGKRLKVPREYVMTLCAEIIKQIKRRKIQEDIKRLESVIPSS